MRIKDNHKELVQLLLENALHKLFHASGNSSKSPGTIIK